MPNAHQEVEADAFNCDPRTKQSHETGTRTPAESVQSTNDFRCCVGRWLFILVAVSVCFGWLPGLESNQRPTD